MYLRAVMCAPFSGVDPLWWTRCFKRLCVVRSRRALMAQPALDAIRVVDVSSACRLCSPPPTVQTVRTWALSALSRVTISACSIPRRRGMLHPRHGEEAPVRTCERRTPWNQSRSAGSVPRSTVQAAATTRFTASRSTRRPRRDCSTVLSSSCCTLRTGFPRVRRRTRPTGSATSSTRAASRSPVPTAPTTRSPSDRSPTSSRFR